MIEPPPRSGTCYTAALASNLLKHLREDFCQAKLSLQDCSSPDVCAYQKRSHLAPPMHMNPRYLPPGLDSCVSLGSDLYFQAHAALHLRILYSSRWRTAKQERQTRYRGASYPEP